MSVGLVIRKQKFIIKTGDEQLAMRLRRQVNDELQYTLLDVYKEVMNANAAGFDQDIYIDKITISLGRCSEEEWAKKLPPLLKKKLEASMSGFTIDMEGDSFSSDPFVFEQETTIVEGQHNEATALMYFLEKGIYPWWFVSPSTSAQVKKPGEIIAATPDSSLEAILVKLVATSYSEAIVQRMRRRFVQVISTDEQLRVIRLLISLQSDESWKTNMQLLGAPDTERYLLYHTSITAEVYRAQLISFLLQHAREGKAGLREFIQFLFSHAATVPAPSSMPHTNVTIHEKVAEIISDLVGDNKTSEGAGSSLPGETTESSGVKREPGNSLPVKSKPGKDEEKIRRQPGNTEEFPEEGIYIENGGLVLLHPFLQPLFNEFGLLEADHFVSAAAQQRAAVLLYYLHQHDSRYEECEMAFNKIVCGLPVEEVLPSGIALTEQDMKECDQLLDTVAGYWEALKGASGDAIRETFLKRKAKLRFKEDHWLVQVERNATDILVDRLPWGIGIIKLPWLSQLIYVEW